ncbi:hypothetical protein NDU88_005741 [Pleurodeles waltl]|uniref:Uncharacterized protein n=1 Tax=Pleurodeles waltl TaxID=8319 RepID=A0AAV7WYJ7_PLEWA|nr:hypothetical protein NDU88_005741 [Pleurodeles waltl]
MVAVGDWRSDRGVWMPETCLKARKAVGSGAAAQPAGELWMTVQCSGLRDSLCGEGERRRSPRRQGARCPGPPPCRSE